MNLPKKILDDLNKDLSLEYGAAIQYVQHYGILSGAQYMHIRSELEKHAQEELSHALTLSDLITYYGGRPTIEVSKVYEAKNVVDNLKLDLASENNAINRYRQRISEVEKLNVFELGGELRKILKDELDHANELTLALNI